MPTSGTEEDLEDLTAFREFVEDSPVSKSVVAVGCISSFLVLVDSIPSVRGLKHTHWIRAHKKKVLEAKFEANSPWYLV